MRGRTVFFREGRQVAIVHKTGADKKYADVVQFKLDNPTLDGVEHTSSIAVRVSTGYGTAYTINYTYTATALSQVVTALNSAIDAAKVADGWTNVLWAYIADANGIRSIVTQTPHRLLCNSIRGIIISNMFAQE